MKSNSLKNIIMLTSGLSGSSILNSLIAKAGYWVGDSTFKKDDYNTFENDELVKLNIGLIRESGHKFDYTMVFKPEAIESISILHDKVDKTPYLKFIEKCDENVPWIWKDPRLWLTIRFWAQLLSLDDCKFILLTRELSQKWISSTLRRQIQSYSYIKRYNKDVNNSIGKFFRKHKLKYLHIVFEDMILNPEKVLNQLNKFIHTDLSVDDLRSIYRGKLHRKSKNSVDLVKAFLIYTKNFSQRYK